MKIGIDLGGSHIAIGVIDKNGQIIEKFEKRLLEKEKKNIKNRNYKFSQIKIIRSRRKKQ